MYEGIAAPDALTQRLARRAVEIAQVIGPRKSGKALNSLIPFYQTGVIGIEVPDEVAYLMDLDQGIKAHAMVDLSGRVIPIRNTDGTISFRRAGANQIGNIPIITRLAKDGRIKESKPEWVYPKKPALKVLENSLNASVEEWKRTVTSKEVLNLLMQTDAKDDLGEIFYGKNMI
jgi:hypothetical protein